MTRLDYQKSLPVRGAYDVLVAGAGPAGICAAVAAARAGARVALIERYGIVGGMLTSGHVGPILGMVGRGTLRDELLGLLGVPDNDMIGEVGVAHDFERAKRVLVDFLANERIDVYLQTTVADALTSDGRVTGLLLTGKDGLFALTGSVTVDATGDGDVACFSGCTLMKGRDGDHLMQPTTLEFTIDQVDEREGVVCIGDVDEVMLGDERFLDYCRRCGEAGLLPKSLVAVRLHRTTQPGERQVNTTQCNFVDATDARVLYPAERTLRRQIELLLGFFRENLPGYARCRQKSSGSTLGVRETRRVLGEYTITAEALAAGKRFADVVVHKAEFIVDIHNPAGPGQAEAKIQYVVPYDLPYGCFVPKGVDGLLVAGRCISGTHRAHASYRVMSICMAMGHAVGVAAALCARDQVAPRALSVPRLQRALTDQGVDLWSD